MELAKILGCQQNLQKDFPLRACLKITSYFWEIGRRVGVAHSTTEVRRCFWMPRNGSRRTGKRLVSA
jgi:hypothetical protein